MSTRLVAGFPLAVLHEHEHGEEIVGHEEMLPSRQDEVLRDFVFHLMHAMGIHRLTHMLK